MRRSAGAVAPICLCRGAGGSIVVAVRSLLALAVLVVVLAAPAAAQACSLAAVSPQARVASADAAVWGKVLSRESVGPAAPGAWDATYRYRVRVLRAYKGRPGRTVEVVGSVVEPMCGVGLLEVGERQGFLLRGRSGPFQVTLASLISRAELERGSRARRRHG